MDVAIEQTAFKLYFIKHKCVYLAYYTIEWEKWTTTTMNNRTGTKKKMQCIELNNCFLLHFWRGQLVLSLWFMCVPLHITYGCMRELVSYKWCYTHLSYIRLASVKQYLGREKKGNDRIWFFIQISSHFSCSRSTQLMQSVSIRHTNLISTAMSEKQRERERENKTNSVYNSNAKHIKYFIYFWWAM